MGLERLPIARSGRVSGVKVAASAISGPLRVPLVHTLVALVLFGWAFTVFDGARSRTTFHPDESDWIATGRLFGYLFLRGGLKHEVWNGGYYMLAQPPGFRYAVGAGLWLQGHDLNTLNQTYRFDGDLEANRREGRVPTGAVLMDARKVAILLAAVLLIWLLTYLAGVAWGYSLNWPRYVTPLFLMAALLSGLGAESLLRWLGARYAWRDMFAPRGSDGDLERATVGTDRPAHVPNARPPSHRRRPRRGHPLPHHG